MPFMSINLLSKVKLEKIVKPNLTDTLRYHSQIDNLKIVYLNKVKVSVNLNDLSWRGQTTMYLSK